MARWQLFGSLVPVPSVFLNKLQEAVYGQRANGPANTSSMALDSNLNSFDQRLVQFAPDSTLVDSVFPAVLDSAIDWVDRNITVRWKFDYTRDIRPGKPEDWKYPEEAGEVKLYLVPTGHYYPISPAWGLFISAGSGDLMFYKKAGYLYVEIESGTKLKER